MGSLRDALFSGQKVDLDALVRETKREDERAEDNRLRAEQIKSRRMREG